MNLEVRESKFPEELEEMKSKFSSEFSSLEKEFQESQSNEVTEKDFYASLEKAQENLDTKEKELKMLYKKARSNLKEYQDNHYKSKQKFYKLLSHTEFNFDGWAIYGTSEEAEKNRSNFVDFVEKISNKYKCFMPQDKTSFKEFINTVGKEFIEKYPAEKWDTRSRISEYFEDKTPDYKPISKNKVKEKELEIEDFKPFVEGLEIIEYYIKEYIKEGDYSQRIIFAPYHSSSKLFSKLLKMIPNTITKLKLLTIYNLDTGKSLIPNVIFENFPRHLTDLDISDTNITDSRLKYLPRNLTSLDISGTTVTDTGFKDLPQNLTTLSLRSTKITGIWIKDLPQNLTDLNLRNTDITNAYLKDLPQNLTDLNLRNTDITNAYLKDLPKTLTNLDLTDTFINDTGLKWLEENIPNCEVLWLIK